MQDSTFDEEVFFSYASEDLEQVRQLARRLWDDYRISSFVADDALRDLARKRKGFALIKAEMKAPSSTYWLKTSNEEVGVKWIEMDRQFTIKEEIGFGKSYGVLVVCNNPFSRPPTEHKIIIFSGFSGVATYGMSKLLTSMESLEEFFKIDQRFGSLESDFEALIGVQYAYDVEGQDAGDRRRLVATEPVTVEAMVEIPRLA